MILTCKDRLPKRCLKLYQSMNECPYHLRRLGYALDCIDEILVDLEDHDHAYSKEYTAAYKQWKVLSKAFYKALKQWNACILTNVDRFGHYY